MLPEVREIDYISDTQKYEFFLWFFLIPSHCDYVLHHMTCFGQKRDRECDTKTGS